MKIVIVGGGIAGMYCAYQLANERNNEVHLFELNDKLGGRIETYKTENGNFNAEFGPMRFEQKVQPKFTQLVEDLGLEFVGFSGTSAGQIDYPIYDLYGDEKGLNSLELLKRGLLLLANKNLSGDAKGEKHQAWIDNLSEEDFDEFRKTQKLPNSEKFLWQLGFWNALSRVLSHQALMKIRDTGTFYHFIFENLNAVEWTVWWLRALKTDAKEFSTLKQGSSSVPLALEAKLEKYKNVFIKKNVEVTSFKYNIKKSVIEIESQGIDGSFLFLCDRLILALPKAPLQRLAHSLPQEICKHLDTVIGSPLVKVIAVVKNPWWDENTSPQTKANRMPTREVHYYTHENFNNTTKNRIGMALIYTDSPGTEFWKQYTKNKEQREAEINKNDDLKEECAKWLAEDIQLSKQERQTNSHSLFQSTSIQAMERREVFAALTVEECVKKIKQTIIEYGIRDWGLQPYGAATHCWRPKVKSWEIQQQLKAFCLPGSPNKNVHICNEAYSNYSGFIEGSLNSVQEVIKYIKSGARA
jgi:protoporphyrinogen oxidase